MTIFHDSILKNPTLVNYCIYNGNIISKDMLEFEKLESDITLNGFCTQNKFYNDIDGGYPFKHLEKQTSESRLEYFKLMLKPIVSSENRKKALALMLCLRQMVKEKKLHSKVPKPVLLNLIIIPIFDVFNDVRTAVDKYKIKSHKGTVNNFLCNNFDQWYQSELIKSF